MPTTRDAILDGALQVMRTKGLARTTTKEIAAAAGYSEATLYKLFADKVDLFLCVLSERLPPVSVVREDPAGLVGAGTVTGNLQRIAAELERFYRASLPIAMSLFSDTELLTRHRQAVRDRGTGPEVVTTRVAAYLRGEQAAGRIAASAEVTGAATALVGACMHAAFLTCFTGESPSPGPADFVTALLPGLLPLRHAPLRTTRRTGRSSRVPPR
jgi:AcrR family transcriptional regulator